MDYTTLTSAKTVPGSIANWMNDSTIVAQTPTIVTESQDWIYRKLRHWRMIPPPITGSMSTSALTQAIPSDMLEPDFFLITGIYRRILYQKTFEEVMAAWAYDGNGVLIPQQPAIYAFDSTNFSFDSVPDKAYPYALRYFQQPAPLSSGNNTNFLTNFCARLFRTVLTMMACEWTKEVAQGQFDRTYWEQQAEAELQRVQIESDRSKRAVTGGWIQGAMAGEAGGPGWVGYPG